MSHYDIEKDDWKSTGYGFIIFLVICFFVMYLGDKRININVVLLSALITLLLTNTVYLYQLIKKNKL